MKLFVHSLSGIYVFCAVVISSILLFVVGCVRSIRLGTSVSEGFTRSHHRQPRQTGVVARTQLPATTSRRLSQELFQGNMICQYEQQHPATTTMAQSAPVMHFQTYRPRNHWHNLRMKKTATMSHGGLNGSTTTPITTSDITHAVGCHSSCHYHCGHGLLLVLAFVTDGWLLHLIFSSSMWLLLLFLSCRTVVASLTPLPMLLPLFSPSPLPPHCTVLCCSALKYCQRAASTPDSVTAAISAIITITTLAVLSAQKQNSLMSNLIVFSPQATFLSSGFDHVHVVIVETDTQGLRRRNGIEQASFFKQKSKIIVLKVQETCSVSTTSSLSRLMINHRSRFDWLASCIKMMPTACAIVDARLSAFDLLTSGPFLTIVFMEFKWIYLWQKVQSRQRNELTVTMILLTITLMSMKKFTVLLSRVNRKLNFADHYDLTAARGNHRWIVPVA